MKISNNEPDQKLFCPKAKTWKCQCAIKINGMSAYTIQKYLDILSIVKYRKSLSRLRLSSHRLEVEVGRWTKPNKTPYERRKCKDCNVLEDEFHFLFECPLYTDL